MELKREWIEALVFGDDETRRYTQDSPILPDVWIRYGTNLAKGHDEPVDLLLTPHLRVTAGDLVRVLRTRLTQERLPGGRSAHLRTVKSITRRLQYAGADGLARVPHPDVAYNQSTVVARMYLDELIRVALPLTRWWHQHVCGTWRAVHDVTSWAGRKALERSLERMSDSDEMAHTDLAWLVRLVGCFLLAAEEGDAGGDEVRPEEKWRRIVHSTREQVDRFRGLVLDPMGVPDCDDDDAPELMLFMVSQNRDARPTIGQSALAVKADAARRVFDASCRDLNWVIMDSGVDATHGAFRMIVDGKAVRHPFSHDQRGPRNNTRIRATFDFTRVRALLSVDPEAAFEHVALLDQRADSIEAELATLHGPEHESERRRLRGLAAKLRAQRDRWWALASDGDGEADQNAKALRAALLSGRAFNWDELRPFLEIPHETGLYAPPVHDHGTHVAGVLAADWRKTLWEDPDSAAASSSAHTTTRPPEYPDGDDLVGVCPDIQIYDFRVFDTSGKGDEFSVMAALQFLRHLNAQRDVQLIHGVNLSLSIRHDVANFACGRTPVCDECERVVSSGVVVVAAAGNRGYNRFDTRTETGAGSTYEGYSAISITDPGNAEGVITVGATHRIEPHTYGVSYFSSRGPTGDGRYKPDLVAPGEKIRAPVPGNRSTIKDGTSMAAPHVSGAAALVLARYREFIGRPQRVRQVLCSTATDLGRDRYFQGAGMVDILRALQSV